ncbi:hypothetical protein JCM8547_007202 [Rhodosporidiobolus lusitaniae]
MAARPPLPFGLGRDPTCAPHRCLFPGTPLPAPGTPLHDQVAQRLSQLFQTFFSTSLRYLGVSEVLDWVESSGTIDAWILTGLEQGRLPDEVGNKKNLEFGREAIKSVIKNALDAEDEAWATSLRETGFSSSVSMVYEGIVAQLKPSKSAPLPCLHTLLTPTGLTMLKSAPLKSAFPICPPRSPPSCSPLLAAIRSLVTSGALTGAVWKTPTVWRAAIRKAFAAYHTLLREIAEELVSARSFAKEFYIFLENISQPIQLLQLIADDFEAEFGVRATRGLLGVGDAGGSNLIAVLDFCASKKPSELLARVKQRVAEKQEREKRLKEVEAKRARLKELDAKIRVLLLEYRNKGSSAAASALAAEVVAAGGGKEEIDARVDEIAQEAAVRLQKELEATLDERDAIKADVEELQLREEEDERQRKKDRAEKEKALAAVGVKVEGGRLKATPVPPSKERDEAEKQLAAALAAEKRQNGEAGEEEEAVRFVVGSSKDLLPHLPPSDPFATNAPRALSPVIASAKGKGKAPQQATKSRGAHRYAPRPPTNRYTRLRDFSPAPPSNTSRPGTPVSSCASSPAPSASSAPASRRTSRKRAPPSNSSSTSPSQSRRTGPRPGGGSRLRPSSVSPSPSPSPGRDRFNVNSSMAPLARDEDDCEACSTCPACAEEHRRAQEMIDQTHRRRNEQKKELRRDFGLVGGTRNGRQIEVEVEVRVEMEEEEEEVEQMREEHESQPMSRDGSGETFDSMPELTDLPHASSAAPPPLPPPPAPASAAATNMGTSRSTDPHLAQLIPVSESLPHAQAAKPSTAPQPVEEEEEDVDDPPEVALEPVDPPQHPLTETTNTAANPVDGSSSSKKKKKKKKKPASKQQQQATTIPPPLDSLHAASAQQAQGLTPLSRYPPPKCCPPHHCTGVGPNYSVWPELDSLLYETCLAGFKYELIGALPSALFLVRNRMAENYLLAGGRMTTETGEPKEMDTYLAQAEQRGLWHSVNYPEVQAWGQRVLAISLQKLVDVLRATLGDICICKMSQHLDILREAKHRLSSCEQLDRQIPIDLPEMDHQAVMKWCHAQLREQKLSGPEWQSLSRQYLVQDFLLSFSDAFDAAMDRLVLRDPLLLAEDISTLLEWQGGVRTFETALRLGAKDREGIVVEFGTGQEILEGTEQGVVERRPLQSWGRLLELSAEARRMGTPFSRDLAEQEKQRGNEFFAAGEHEKAIVSFSTASIIVGYSEPTYSSNAAAARMKLGTAAQYSEAICDCTLALFCDPRNIKALYRRGMALALTGHWKAAFADLKHLDRIAPECQPAKEALAWANERYAALQASKAVK